VIAVNIIMYTLDATLSLIDELCGHLVDISYFLPFCKCVDCVIATVNC